jgi:hypothetical protein
MIDFILMAAVPTSNQPRRRPRQPHSQYTARFRNHVNALPFPLVPRSSGQQLQVVVRQVEKTVTCQKGLPNRGVLIQLSSLVQMTSLRRSISSIATNWYG